MEGQEMAVAEAVQTQQEQQPETTISGSISATAYEEMMEKWEKGKEEPAAEQTASAEAAKTEAKPAEPATTEAAKPVVTEPVTDWKDSLKGKELKEVLQALGVDEKMAALIDHQKKNGDIKPWIEAYTKDYNKMDAAELLRLKIQRDYAGTASPEDIELVVESKLSKYNLDPEVWDEKEVRLAKIELNNDVKAFRELMNKEQSETLIPATNPQEALQQQQAQLQATLDAKTKANQDFIRSSEPVKKFLAEKKITIGTGEDAYHLPIADPQAALQFLLDNQRADSVTEDNEGNPTAEAQLLIVAIAQNPHKALQDAVAYGIKLGQKKTVTEFENPSTGANQYGSKADVDIVEMLALHGKPRIRG